MLQNFISDWPSDSHPATPRRGTYLFPARDCIKFVLFLTLLGGGEKKTCLADARHTLVAAGSQKHFIYVWMAAGVQFCLAHTVCCGLWHLHASLLSPWHKLSPSLSQLCCILHAYTRIYMYVCICMCLEVGMNSALLLFALRLTSFFTEYRIEVAGSGSYQFFIQ